MAGKATYKPEEIYWILRKVFQFRVSDNDLIMTQFQTEFGRELLKTQLRYVKQAYGDSPDYNCPRSTKYPMLPKHENLWNLQKRRVSKKRGVRRESVKSVYDEFVMNAKGPLDPRPEEADPSHERMDMSDYSEREADSGSSQMSEALNRTTPRSDPRKITDAPARRRGYHDQSPAVQTASGPRRVSRQNQMRQDTANRQSRDDASQYAQPQSRTPSISILMRAMTNEYQAAMTEREAKDWSFIWARADGITQPSAPTQAQAQAQPPNLCTALESISAEQRAAMSRDQALDLVNEWATNDDTTQRGFSTVLQSIPRDQRRTMTRPQAILLADNWAKAQGLIQPTAPAQPQMQMQPQMQPQMQQMQQLQQSWHIPEQRNRSTFQNSEFRPQATSSFPAHQGQFGRYVHQAPGNSHPALPLDTRLPMEIDPNVFELSAMAETHRQVADMQTSGQGHTTQPPANVGPNSQGMGNSAQQATGNGSHFPQQVSEGTFEPGVSELAANAETDEGNRQETITCGQLELNTEHSRPSRLSPGEPQQSMEPSLGDEAGYRKYSMEQLAHEQPDEGQLTSEQPAYGQHTTGQPPDELFGGPLDWTLPDQSLTDWLDPGQNFTSEDVDRMFAPAAAMSQSGDASFGAGVSDCIEVATSPAGPSHAPASNGGHVGVNDRSP